MFQAQRGFRDKIEKYISIDKPFDIVLTTEGKAEYDACCFCVDERENLIGDPYMVFYNQLNTPEGGVKLHIVSDKIASFTVDLTKNVPTLNKMVFCVSIDGDQTMGEIVSHTITIRQETNDAIVLPLTGADFSREKAVISVEVYQKNGWRIAFPAMGFNGGLGDLLRKYGGEEETEPQQAPTQQAHPVSAAHPSTQNQSARQTSGGLRIIAIPQSIGRAAGIQEEVNLFYYGRDTVNMGRVRSLPDVPKEVGLGHDDAKVVETISKFVSSSGGSAIVVILTAGEIGAPLPLLRALKRAPANIVWKYIGVGGAGFSILENIESMVPNASFEKYSSIQEYIQNV